MSFLFSKRKSLADLGVPSRSMRRVGSVTVTNTSALTHSAVWAALRLRANLVSTMPVDEYRRVGGVQQAISPKSPFVESPGSLYLGGKKITAGEWLYATQFDLDRGGNCFGFQDFDSRGALASVALTPLEAWSVNVRGGEVEYRFEGKKQDPREVWHERQYVVAGVPVGLSAVMVSSAAIGQYLSAQQFALDWFSGGAVPTSSLKNTQKKIDPSEATTVKDRWMASVRAGEPVVLGADWEYSMISALANQSEFLATQKFSIADVCRFFDIPGDMIDAESSSGSVTYANITQRNLQLLVTAIGPAVKRREDALSAGLPTPRYVKLNTDAILRMDPKTRYEMLAIGVDKRAVTPNEWRELDDRPPLTPEQEAEFARLFNPKTDAPQKVSS